MPLRAVQFVWGLVVGFSAWAIGLVLAILCDYREYEIELHELGREARRIRREHEQNRGTEGNEIIV